MVVGAPSRAFRQGYGTKEITLTRWRWRSNDALRASVPAQQASWPEVDIGLFLTRLLPGKYGMRTAGLVTTFVD